MSGDEIEANRSLRADGGAEVFQAGGDQYIFGAPGERPAPARMLPRDTAPLIGRDAEIATLMAGHTLYLIDGMPGVGKTTLAVHVAHRLRPDYPDGDFFVDLHAHTAGMRAVTPDEALYQLLIADSLTPGQIAVGVQARAAQWRSRLAGRRCVVVLDNALDRAQVAPLLPAGGDSVVLVTSRRRLAGLIAQHAADPLELPTLTEASAAVLFARRSGRDPHGDEAAAIAEIVRDCGTLPLPICLLAAQLRARPHRSAADLLRELRRAAHPTSRMRAEDLAVGPAFDLSFRRLPKPLRRFLVRLGMLPGADVDVPAAAALTGVGPDRAEAFLESLVEEHLVVVGDGGRYRLHDLIGDYARSRNPDGVAEQVAALVRLATDYERRVGVADRALAVPYPPDPVRVEARVEALGWLQRERVNLMACVTALARTGEHELVARLTTGLAASLREAGPWEQAITLYHLAAENAARHDAHAARAAALRELGVVLYLRSDYESAKAAFGTALAALHDAPAEAEAEEAVTLTRLAAARRQSGERVAARADADRALSLFRRSGDRAGEGDALAELGTLHLADREFGAAVDVLREAAAVLREHGGARACADVLNRLGAGLQNLGQNEEAVALHEHALHVCRVLGDLRGVAVSLNYVGHLYCQFGEFGRAAAALEEALILHDRMRSRSGSAHCLTYLGRAYRELGRYEDAGDATRRALSTFREMKNLAGYASTLNQLGILHRNAGDLAAAETAHGEALEVFERLEHALGQAEVLNAQGDLNRLRHRTDRALEQHRRALVLAQRAGSGEEQARAHEGIGHCLTERGEHRPGRDSIRTARDILERLGAHPAAHRLAELLPEDPHECSSGRRRLVH
ncbi:tetratricopeptide (TPR) repeat protein [Catenuloplanes nepalensis]|uniref:Tetratricopeptide (TPR) repeat protein n=1 Tax=Catenuloplanes nepalensis TaxID=587533 RepID=A0ABT9MQT9_9ACTN|nr:tetratricopeptide repeat protein [Catenuloplanes nepalensis]MDP9793780.1 tetratricopeptide (TPR) repeat protein [Catenuloplanes nepalensis]